MIDELQREIEVVAELSRKAIFENAHVAINQDEWHEQNNGYLERHHKASERVTALEELKRKRQSKSLKIDSFLKNARMPPMNLMTEFGWRQSKKLLFSRMAN